MNICEKCGSYYDAWDGHCDCEDNEYEQNTKTYAGGVNTSERNINIQQINIRDERGF